MDSETLMSKRVKVQTAVLWRVLRYVYILHGIVLCWRELQYILKEKSYDLERSLNLVTLYIPPKGKGLGLGLLFLQFPHNTHVTFCTLIQKGFYLKTQ